MNNENESCDQLREEIAALLNGWLDAERAHAVAAHFADDKDSAATLFSDIANVEALRLALSGSRMSPSPQLVAAAARMNANLRLRRFIGRAMPIAAAAALVAVGWLGNAAWQTVQAAESNPLIKAALDAEAALDLRHEMASQPESVELDSQEIATALGIDLPRFPSDWSVRDVQIVTTPERPGVAIALDSPQLGRLMLMAVARNATEPDEPLTAFEYEGRTVALFERGRSAIVLIDESGHPEQLASGADRLLTQKW